MTRPIIPTRTRRAMQDAAAAREFNTTIDVWRTPPPPVGGGKSGTPAQVLNDIPAQLREANGQDVVNLAPAGLSGTRVEWICRVRAEIDLRMGDEVRDTSGAKYKVEGVTSGVGILRIVALSKIKAQ